jgi:o-succinylbenzoate---CoA ligase
MSKATGKLAAAFHLPLLFIDGIPYSRADLASGRILPADQSASENTQAALAFVRSWLQGDSQFVVQTSGSTGEPKAVTLTREQMTASALATGSALDLAAGEHALVCLPARYIAGRMMLVRGLALELVMHLVEPAADPLAHLSPDLAITFAAFVPLQLQTLLDIALVASSDSCFPEDTARAFRYRRLLEGMTAILVGGAPVTPAMEAQIRLLSAPVYHTYGMTETATHVALRRLNGPEASPAFRPLARVVTGVDTRGCLQIAGPMTGGITLQTNDLVALEPDGSFRWLGRWDHVINSGGVKVHVETVEAAVERLAIEQRELGLARRRFFVAGLPDARLGEQVVLIVEGAPLDADQETQLLWDLTQELDRHHAPRRVLYVPHFVETPSGKIDRKATIGSDR